MSDPRSIELFEDLDFQRRQWRWQRAGWVLMGLFAVAGLLGLFGSGPFSSDTVRSADDALSVEYERFVRRDSPSTLQATLSPPTSRAGRVELHLDRAFVDGTLIQSIVPEPVRVSAAADGITYHFDSVQPGHALVVTFELEAKHAGAVRTRMRTAGGGEVAIDQLVYP